MFSALRPQAKGCEIICRPALFLSLAVAFLFRLAVFLGAFVKHVAFEMNIFEDKQDFIVFLNGKNTMEQLFKPA